MLIPKKWHLPDTKGLKHTWTQDTVTTCTRLTQVQTRQIPALRKEVLAWTKKLFETHNPWERENLLTLCQSPQDRPHAHNGPTQHGLHALFLFFVVTVNFYLFISLVYLFWFIFLFSWVREGERERTWNYVGRDVQEDLGVLRNGKGIWLKF